MSDGSTIEWLDRPGTKPASWNPIVAYRDVEMPDGTTKRLRGWHCEHVHSGCEFCYAEGFNERLGTKLPYKPGHRGDISIELHEATLLQPLKWCAPRTIFVASMTDLYGPWVKDEWLDKIKAVQALTPQHTYIELTKRPERMKAYLTTPQRHLDIRSVTWSLLGSPKGSKVVHNGLWRATIPMANVWGLVSCSTQEDADKFIPILLATPLAIRGVSAEPLLGKIDFENLPSVSGVGRHLDALSAAPFSDLPAKLDWIIVGGESGRNARPMHPDWARSIKAQCEAAGVPMFFKQFGEYGTAAYLMGSGTPVFRQFATFDQWVNKASTWVNGGICLDTAGRELKNGKDFMTARDSGRFPVTIMHRVGKKAAGRLLDGATHNGFPQARTT